jgi:hypothetical protein
MTPTTLRQRLVPLLGVGLCAMVVSPSTGAAQAPVEKAPVEHAPLEQDRDEQGPRQVEFHALSLADALSRAENERKLLMVFWSSVSMPDAAKMRTTTFRDPLLADWVARNAIAVEVDGPSDPTAAAAYRIRAYPSVDLFDAVLGLGVERLEGYASADDLLGAFSGALVGGAAAPKPDGEALEDPYAWLAYANSMWRRGKDSAHEAARAYGWVLRNADTYRPGFRARYFEFLLRRIAYLKPTAREAFEVLLAERAVVESQVAGDAVDARTVHELVRLDWWLRQQSKTRETFQMLAGRGGKAELARQLLFRHVIDDLGRYQLFDDILTGLGETSGAAYFTRRIATIDTNVARQAQGERLREEELDNRGDAVLAATWIYEALLAAGRGKDAKELVGALAELAPTGRAFALLVERALRQGLPDVALEVGTRGLPLVKGQTGERQLERALAKVPGYVPPPDDPPAGGDGDDGG